MLASAVRVPDHGKRVPFRFLKIAGDARHTLGNFLAERSRQRDPHAGEAVFEKDRQRFSHAPLVIVVVASPRPDPKVPEQEQLMTAGCVCFALLQAAQALGFGAQWLTARMAFDPPCTPTWAWPRARASPVSSISVRRRPPYPSASVRTRPRCCATGRRRHEPAGTAAFAVPGRCQHLRVPRPHSLPDQFQDAQGWPTNAVHGFARFLLDLLERERPQHIAIAFDEALDSGFRHRLYPAYKANRDPAPEALKRQFVHCKALCAALGLAVLAHHEYEADDLIGSALHVHRSSHRGVIISADKDLSQLLADHDEQWDYARNQRWNVAGVKARHGVHAHQIADYLALCGDAVDNIPGISGVGSKSAAVLLAHFGSMDALYERPDEVPFLRLRGAAQMAVRLREQREHARLWRQLTTIALDAPLEGSQPGLLRRGRPGTARWPVPDPSIRPDDPPPAVRCRWRGRPSSHPQRARMSQRNTEAPRVVYEGKYQRMVVRGTWNTANAPTPAAWRRSSSPSPRRTRCCSSNSSVYRCRPPPSRCRPAWSATSTPANRLKSRPCASSRKKPAGPPITPKCC